MLFLWPFILFSFIHLHEWLSWCFGLVTQRIFFLFLYKNNFTGIFLNVDYSQMIFHKKSWCFQNIDSSLPFCQKKKKISQIYGLNSFYSIALFFSWTAKYECWRPFVFLLCNPISLKSFLFLSVFLFSCFYFHLFYLPQFLRYLMVLCFFLI